MGMGLNKKTILIIEDNEEAILLYGEILRAENFEVIETSHGKEALAWLDSAQTVPDLIMMDLSFPHMSAKEFVTQLRQQEIFRQIPVLVISGNVETQELARGLNASGFIIKPFDLDDFVSTVKRIIQSPRDPIHAS